MSVFLVSVIFHFWLISFAVLVVLVCPWFWCWFFSRVATCCSYIFPFLSARGGRVEVRRWTRNPLARLRSTPEDSQPLTSLMVSQSVFLYLRDICICLVEPMFDIPWIPLVLFHIFFKNEDFSVKIFHIYYSYFKNE